MEKQAQRIHWDSLSIVTKVLEDSIVNNTLHYCLPKQYAYHDSSRKAQLIQNTIINLYSSNPDSQANNMKDIKDYTRNPTSFKIKQMKSAPQNVKQRQKYRKLDPSITRSNSNHLTVSQVDRIKQISKLQSQSRISHISSSCQFYPFDHRSRNRSKLVRLKTNESQKQNNMELIKVFRQNLFLKPHYFQDFQKQKTQISESSVSVKKTKQPANKKVLALNTDYSGLWIQINRNDIKKQANHFIQLEAEVIQDMKQPQQPKKQQQVRTISTSDYSNYKELKFAENQNTFTANVLKKTKNKSDKKLQADLEQPSTMKNMEMYINSGKMIGKNVTPAKVGFNVFEQMKRQCMRNNSMNKQEDSRGQESKMKTTANYSEERHSKDKLSSLGKEDRRKSRVSHKVMEKTQNVVVKNQSAHSYLLSDNVRGYKKKVTIVQNCI